ncbi:MAG: pilus assembly protein PilM [Desulfobacteraceae bacterium]|nr:pilus assembly protein PilM [Desulfobacteraceae bacterium]
MSRKTLGIDIRYDSVSAMLVKSGLKGNWIEDYVYVPVSDQYLAPVQPGEEVKAKDGFTVGTALETIRSRMDTDGSVFAVSFPADQASYRNIYVPFRDQKKIRQVIPFELEPALPFPVEELVMDFHPVTNSKRVPDANHTDIIAAAIEKAKIQSYMDILVSLDMEPEIITVGGYPAALCLARFSNTPENWMFADISKTRCTIFAVSSGQISLIRSFPVSFMPNSGKASRRGTEMLCDIIQRTVSSFDENLHSGFRPEEMLITGHGLNYPDFEHEAELILDIPVKRADIIRDTGAVVKYAPRDILPEHRIQMDNAFALALMENEGIGSLNFRRGPFAPKREWAEHKGSFISSGILACLVLVALFFNVWIEYSSMATQEEQLDSQIESIFKSAFPNRKYMDNVALKLMETAVEDAKKVEMIPKELEKNIKTVDIFNEISKLIPAKIDVELSRLVIALENVQINGNTDSFNSVDEIQSQLEKSTFFKRVTIITNRKVKDRIQFKIKADLSFKNSSSEKTGTSPGSAGPMSPGVTGPSSGSIKRPTPKKAGPRSSPGVSPANPKKAGPTSKRTMPPESFMSPKKNRGPSPTKTGYAPPEAVNRPPKAQSGKPVRLESPEKERRE